VPHHLYGFLLLLSLQILKTSAEEFPIPGGVVTCSDSDCLIRCDYGNVPTGTYKPDLSEVGEVQCEAAATLVAGGFNRGENGFAQEDVVLQSAEVYSVLPGGDGGCDGRLPDLPWEGGRKNMVGGWVAGVAIICGGVDDEGDVRKSCVFYTPEDENAGWQHLADMEEARSEASATVVEGCLLVSGGVGVDGEPLDSVEVIKTAGCESIPFGLQKLDSPRYGHCLVEVGPQMFVSVGGSPDQYDNAQVYSETGGWVSVAGPQKSRYGHGCVPFKFGNDTAVLVAGNNFSPSDLSEVYYLDSDSWAWTSYMQAERDGPSVVVLGGLPTAIGGYSHDSHIYQVTGESYDPSANRWTLRTAHDLGESRKDAVAFSVPQEAFCR